MKMTLMTLIAMTAFSTVASANNNNGFCSQKEYAENNCGIVTIDGQRGSPAADPKTVRKTCGMDQQVTAVFADMGDGDNEIVGYKCEYVPGAG